MPVILRLEDFGLELKRDAVSYIIEFVYRGEVNIPGERLTDVCQVKLERMKKVFIWLILKAAHTLGVVGMEHLPVPAPPAPYRPNMSKDHLQIADESELRGEQGSMASLYSSIQTPTSQYQAILKILFLALTVIRGAFPGWDGKAGHGHQQHER